MYVCVCLFFLLWKLFLIFNILFVGKVVLKGRENNKFDVWNFLCKDLFRFCEVDWILVVKFLKLVIVRVWFRI